MKHFYAKLNYCTVRRKVVALMAFLCLGATTLYAQSPSTGTTSPLRLAVISDIHIMHPSLLKQEGAAFADYIRNDRKMLKLGPALLANAVERILKEHPQVVLVTGDLTKDGETVSHHYLCDNYLSRLRAAGIRVFVIPGNHDVDNPHAVEFVGDTTHRVPTPKADEFARIYTDYGFGEAIARDTASLSYAVQLDAHTRLLCLDACEYYDNDYARNICVTKGHLKPATLSFIKAQTAYAKAKGQRVLAMMHHGLVEHWKWQDKAMSEYVVTDWRKMADFFKKQGIEVCFTGHFHSQDISHRGSQKNGVYDIETGSLVSYPSPIRFATLTDHTLTVRTEQVSSDGLDIPDHQTLDEYGQYFARSIVHTYVGNLLSSSLPADLCNKVCDVVARAYAANLAGDETMPDDGRKELKAVVREVRHHSWKKALILSRLTKYLWQDEAPADNSLTITFKK